MASLFLVLDVRRSLLLDVRLTTYDIRDRHFDFSTYDFHRLMPPGAITNFTHPRTPNRSERTYGHVTRKE